MVEIRNMATIELENLIKVLADAVSTKNPNWTSFSIIMGLNKDGVVFENYGYSYEDSGPPISTSTSSRNLREVLGSYLATVYRPDQHLPIKVLVQFDRESLRYNVEYEDHDKDRWAVNPRTIKTVREELRPKLKD
jgi:hypothetical protein